MKKTLKTAFGCVFGAPAWACAGVLLFSGLQVPAWAGGQDVTARNCEIFVDRIQLARETDGTSSLTYLLKVNPSRLDGAVMNVMVYHAQQEFTLGSASVGFEFRTDWLSAINDDETMYAHTVVTGNDWLKIREYSSYFVETDTGSRFWLNSENKTGSEFMTDWDTFESMVDMMSDHLGLLPFEYMSHTMRLESVPRTADAPSELSAVYNPNRCR